MTKLDAITHLTTILFRLDDLNEQDAIRLALSALGKKSALTPAEKEHLTIEFNKLWALYATIRPTSKQRAFEEIMRLRPDKETLDRIRYALAKNMQEWADEKTEKKYIPLFSTWLNKKRWMDFDPADSEELNEHDIKPFFKDGPAPITPEILEAVQRVKEKVNV